MEKKIAVLESLRSVHFKEVARSRFKLERLQSDYQTVTNLLSNLDRDEKMYTSQLSYDKDGSKVNPIQLNGITSVDAEQIGRYIIELYKNWRPLQTPPKEGLQGNDQKIGMLYGFDCYIRQQQESYEEKGLFSYRYHNAFYVQHKDGGIKYSFNQGHPTADNPKLSARHFLNALDRVTKFKEQYQKELHDLDTNIPVLEKIIAKPFEKEGELKAMKQSLSVLEKEIGLKIQEKLKQKETPKDELGLVEEETVREVPVISMNDKAEKQGQGGLLRSARKSRGIKM